MRRARLPLLLSSTLFLAACGSDGTAPASDAQASAAAATAPDQAGPPAERPVLTAADGWADLHDVPLPEPGRAELTIDGQHYAVDITCKGPGEFDPADDETNAYLFRVSFDGRGETPGGQRIWLFGDRRVAAPGPATSSLQEGSKVQLAVYLPDDSGRSHSTIAISPSDDDPAGERLPLLHVSPDGGFTMRAPMFRVGSIHDQAPQGEAVLAARCPDGW